MRRCVRLVPLWAIALVVLSLAVAPAAGAVSSLQIAGLSSTAGYNSVTLRWEAPVARSYRGVTIWRQEGNRADATPVLVKRLDATVTSYVDAGLTVPASGLWSYTVYTRDAAEGPVNPQTTASWMTAAVSGRVTDRAGTGLGGVFVNASSSAWTSGGGAGWTTTAADGSWTVDGVRPGQTVVCFDPDHVVGGASTTGYLSECWDSVPSLRNHDDPATPVTTTLGALTSGLNATLEPAGAIAGVLRDERGHRLANAGVTVMRDDSEVRELVVTGVDGSYRVDGLAPGRYAGCGYQPLSAVQIVPASPFGYLSTCSDGSIGSQPRQNYPVNAAAVTASDITLADGGVITGQLLDPGGRPVVGEFPQREGPYSPDSRTTRTDANGQYRITGLMPGNHTVCFSGTASAGGVDTFDPGRAPRCYKASDPESPTPIAVTLGSVVKGVSVKAYANPSVEGRVVDPQGNGIGGVLVTVGGTATLTEADGRYRVGVAPGTYPVCFDASQAHGASPSGYVDQCWSGQPRWGGTPTPVVVAKGARVTGVGATMAIAAGALVTVVDAHGTPLRNATVYLYHAGQGPNARTDASGVATFTRVYQGNGSDFVAYLARDSYWDATPRASSGYAPVEVPVQITTGMTSVRVVAPSYGSIAGHVTDAAGHPVPSAQLSVQGPNYVPSWSTAADGSYLVPEVVPGAYSVCVSAWVGSGQRSHYATTCWQNASTPATATPVDVADGTDVAAIDLVLR